MCFQWTECPPAIPLDYCRGHPCPRFSDGVTGFPSPFEALNSVYGSLFISCDSGYWKFTCSYGWRGHVNLLCYANPGTLKWHETRFFLTYVKL